MPRYRVTIDGKTYDAMADLVRKHKLNIAGHTARKAPRGRYVVDAFADSEQIELLRAEGYGVEVREDVHEAGRQRQAEVRSLALAAPAGNVATAGHYLNVADIETSLAAAAAGPNAGFTQLINLPNKTWEGRACHAIRIGKGAGAGAARPGIFFLGGIHAREWGSSDILINFVEQLCAAFRTNSGITIGGLNVTAAQIQQVVNQKDIYVFPQANPDGRNHSMTVAPDWRKNRRPAPAGSGNPDCVGVDLNRNYDFLWNYPAHFAPNSPVANSTSPCDHDVYIGPAPVSEPETKNVVWMSTAIRRTSSTTGATIRTRRRIRR
jgi:carboxypeptidase T